MGSRSANSATASPKGFQFSSVFAGYFAGASAVIVGHPFDSLKVRMQLGKSGQNLVMDVQSASSRMNKWRNVARNLYRGIMPPLLTVGSIQSINLSAYEYMRGKLHNWYHNDKFPLVVDARVTDRIDASIIFVAGGLSGALISIFTNPISTIKIQQQVVSNKGMIECVKDMYKIGGLRVFYRAYSCGFSLESIGRGLYLMSYETSKTNLPLWRTTIFSNESRIYNSEYQQITLSDRMTAAVLASFISWIFIYPLDVIRSRMQVDINKSRFPTFYSCVKSTIQEGGFRALYRGIGYTLLRAGPVSATVMPLYDTCKALIEQLTPPDFL